MTVTHLLQGLHMEHSSEETVQDQHWACSPESH